MSASTEHERRDEFEETDGAEVYCCPVASNPYRPSMEREALVVLEDVTENRRDRMEPVSKDMHDEAALTEEQTKSGASMKRVGDAT